MIADATSLLITDNQELVVEKVGDVAQKTTIQLLIDSIAQKVANELVTNSALTTTLANYVTKAMMSNVQVNDQNRVPTSSLAFSMNQAITELNSDLDGHLIVLPGGETAIQTVDGNVVLRLQLDKSGDAVLCRSPDGGATWPTSETVITNANIQTEYNVANSNVLFRCEATDGSAIQLATTATQLQLQKRTSATGSWEIVWTK